MWGCGCCSCPVPRGLFLAAASSLQLGWCRVRLQPPQGRGSPPGAASVWVHVKGKHRRPCHHPSPATTITATPRQGYMELLSSSSCGRQRERLQHTWGGRGPAGTPPAPQGWAWGVETPLTCTSSWSRFLSATAFFCSSGSSSTQTSRPKCSRASFSCISRTCSSCSKEHSFPAPTGGSRHSPTSAAPTPPRGPQPLTESLQLARVEVAEEAEQPPLHLAHVGDLSEEAVLQRSPPCRPRATCPHSLLARPAQNTQLVAPPDPPLTPQHPRAPQGPRVPPPPALTAGAWRAAGLRAVQAVAARRTRSC